jgi:prepilin-type N-terminal cleavage/methylation domain-containing protein
MMKKVKAFTLIEMLIALAIIGLVLASIIPVFSIGHKRRAQEHANVLQLKVGGAVYIDALCITGVVNTVNNLWDIPRVTLLMKGTNGFPTQLESVDVRLLKKVPPSPESEWKP